MRRELLRYLVLQKKIGRSSGGTIQSLAWREREKGWASFDPTAPFMEITGETWQGGEKSGERKKEERDREKM